MALEAIAAIDIAEATRPRAAGNIKDRYIVKRPKLPETDYDKMRDAIYGADANPTEKLDGDTK